MLKLDNQTLLLAFIAVTGLAVLMQAFILLGIYLVVRRTVRTVTRQIDDFRAVLIPLITSTRDLIVVTRDAVDRTLPRIENSVSDLSSVAQRLRAQSEEVQITFSELLHKLRAQSQRADSMMTGVLDKVDRASDFVQEKVSKPVRQVSGIIASVKAAYDVMRGPAPENKSEKHS